MDMIESWPFKIQEMKNNSIYLISMNEMFFYARGGGTIMLCLGKDFNGDILRSDFYSFSIFLNNVIKSLLDVEERNLPRSPGTTLRGLRRDVF